MSFKAIYNVIYNFRGSHIRIYGLALLSGSLMLTSSGCKIGNYEQDPPGPSAAQGYYETLSSPQITICATRPVVQPNGVTQNQTNCAATAAMHSDWYLSDVMTDPVFLQFNSASGLFNLTPSTGADPNLVIPIASDGNGNLAFSAGISGFMTLMETHPNCVFDLSYTAIGTYGQPNGPFNSGSSLPISGRIAMNFVWDYAPSGTPSGNDCPLLLNCYNDPTQCSAQDQAVVQQEFGPFISSGVINVTDIPRVEKLEYQVSYQ